MSRIAALALAVVTGISMPAIAQAREIIGVGRLFTNDFLGDNEDRWRSGSYVLSIVTGKSDYAGTPQPFGDVIEFRLRSEIIAPSYNSASPGDRPYVGALSLGVHSHFGLNRFDASLGVDVLAMGPSTGVANFQQQFHDMFSLAGPKYTQFQLADAVHVGATGEIAMPLFLSDRVTLRPFAEVQTGIEDLARVGADVMINGFGRDEVMLRESSTGQLYRGTEGAAQGFAYQAGFDFAAVDSSVFLPAPNEVTDTRWRARGGVSWQIAPGMSFFYGLTYLSPEFVGQPTGQTLGSVKLNLNF